MYNLMGEIGMISAQVWEIIITLLLGSGALAVYINFGSRMAVQEKSSKDNEEYICKVEDNVIKGFAKMEETFDKRLIKLEKDLVREANLVLKQELAEFENKFLERLNGRYLQTKIAESLIKRSDERYEVMNEQLEELQRLVESKRKDC